MEVGRSSLPSAQRRFAGLAMAMWLVLGMAATACAQQPVLEVIDLRYRSAEQIVPMLKALLAPGGTITALQNRVIVRTTPENLAELHKVLDAVDRLPRQLVISVRQEANETGQASEAEISGSVGGDGARVSVPGSRSTQGATAQGRKGDNVVRGRVHSEQSAASDRGVQTVQVLEGNEALIRLGQSVPVRSRTVIRTPQGAQVSESVEYRDADTGFRVRPRVSGDRVTLEISTRQDTLAAPDTQTFNVQRVDAVVSGKLGQWIELAGVDQSSVRAEGGGLSHRTGAQSAQRRVMLKVDIAGQ